jgi:hypothetical protein
VIVSIFFMAMCAASNPSGIERTPEDWFRRGVETRDDAKAAVEHFAEAANGFDLATPESALARSRAYYLAGQTPQALSAIHAGLALAPYHDELQGDLLAIRESIRVPESADPKLRVRPEPPRSLRHRVSPWESFALAAIFGSICSLGFAMRYTTRPSWANGAMAVGLIGTGFSIALGIHISRIGSPAPVILVESTTLRTGNGASYPPRLAQPLPRGAEVMELGRRGGWVRVELAGGAAGWLPEKAILR